jgi:hypothetical protein
MFPRLISTLLILIVAALSIFDNLVVEKWHLNERCLYIHRVQMCVLST